MTAKGDANKNVRIDSHQHFWQRDRGDYRWMTPKAGAIYRDFLPSDLQPELEKAGIHQTILVQAADTEAETHFLLALAEQSDFVAGVVGWVDMEHPDAAARIQALSQNPYFKGVRPMIQDIADLDWMLKAELSAAFAALIKYDLSLDALVLPQHLGNLQKLLQKHPDLSVVIDHAAKPEIASGNIEPWSTAMQKLAEQTRAYCKLSGLVTEAGERPGACQLQPYVDTLLQCFGADRLMWGSDWPVVKLSMEYQDWLSLSNVLLRKLPPAKIQQILAGTAQTFYRITPATY